MTYTCLWGFLLGVKVQMQTNEVTIALKEEFLYK